LCQWCNSSYNYGKSSKNRKYTPKKRIPPSPPMSCPKPKNCNFWQKCNPQRYTRPPPHIDIWYPKVLWCSSLFPKKSNRNKPNSKNSAIGLHTSCSFTKPLNMWNRHFSDIPINKTNTLERHTTSKCTQQKVFYCSFKRKCTFRIQSTKNNQRKTLQFHTEIHCHQVSCYDKLVTSSGCQKCQVNIFTLANPCNFLPRKRREKNKCSCLEQKASNLDCIWVFLKTPSQKNIVLWTKINKKKREKEKCNCPLSQWRRYKRRTF
jgi:hypothetical protein